MSGKGVLVLSALLLGACAQPKYEKAPDSRGLQEQATADCRVRFDVSGLCLTVKWESLPTEEEFGSFLLKVFRPNAGDGTAVPVDLKTVPAVVLWMPDMGHGSSPVTVERLDLGTYRASRVFFTMRGNWEVRFQLKDADAIQDQARFALTF